MGIHLSKWGNSFGVRIPKSLAQQIGITEGTSIKLEIENKRLIIQKATPTLDELVSKITEENRHPEISTGLIVGNEKW